MSQMFLKYDKNVWESLVAVPAVSGVAFGSTLHTHRIDSNSTGAYSYPSATSGALLQCVMFDSQTNKTYLLYGVTT